LSSSTANIGIPVAVIALLMGITPHGIFLTLSRIWKRVHLPRFGKALILSLAAGAICLGLFYGEENWRGKRAWENCRRELEAKGAVLDWAGLRPAPVSEAENFFKAPKMADWFGGNGNNELHEKLSNGDLASIAGCRNSNILVEVTVVAPEARVSAEEVDLELSYRDFLLTLSDAEKGAAGTPDSGASVIPLIIMDEVPLDDAIRNLARHAGLNYVMDPAVGWGTSAQQPTVSVRWENITARQALTLLLDNYNLQFDGRSHRGIARIRVKDQDAPRVEVDPAARQQLETLMRSALEKGGNQVPIPSLSGSQDLALFAGPIKPVKPLRVMVRTDEWLTDKELSRVFAANSLTGMNRRTGCFRVERSSANSFRVFLGPAVYYTAAGFLGWSDRSRPECDLIRAALKRPFVQLEAECREPAGLPIRNMVIMRLLAQTLAQRAQCHLLLNQPAAALQELTLIHDLRRVLTRKPVNLVAAMINVAVTGVYVSTVADGLEMKRWQEPQLAAIELQLKEIRLMPPVIAAFQWERFNLLRTLERGELVKLMRSVDLITAQQTPPDPLKALRNASYSLLNLLPRGWIYQNMATVGSLHQEFLDAANEPRGIIFPQGIDAAMDRIQEMPHNPSSRNFIAGAVIPNFARAWQVLARNQTLATEAFLACALERHRLARGDFPQTLTTLIPDFADEIPQDVINGQSLRYTKRDDGRFLLYSVGWNGVDDGGVACYSYPGVPDPLRGDWVWSTRSDQ
jgi:hypothetical protein